MVGRLRVNSPLVRCFVDENLYPKRHKISQWWSYSRLLCSCSIRLPAGSTCQWLAQCRHHLPIKAWQDQRRVTLGNLWKNYCRDGSDDFRSLSWYDNRRSPSLHHMNMQVEIRLRTILLEWPAVFVSSMNDGIWCSCPRHCWRRYLRLLACCFKQVAQIDQHPLRSHRHNPRHQGIVAS